MAMASIGGAFSVAASFLGRGTARQRTEPDAADDAAEEDSDTVRDLLTPGDPCFEAVAQALAEAGYLDG